MRKKLLIVALLILLLSAVALIVYRVVFVKMIRVPTGAMANTIVPGDCLIARRLMGAVERGDIVIFSYPSQPNTFYVSRVVGLPGETIQARDTLVYVNGSPLPETRVFVKIPYDFEVGVLHEISTQGSGPYRVFYFQRDENFQSMVNSDLPRFGIDEPVRIPVNEYFVMGDNRDNSLDSRFKGTVPRELIWGKPGTIYWSSHEDGSHRETIKWDRLGKRVK